MSQSGYFIRNSESCRRITYHSVLQAICVDIYKHRYSYIQLWKVFLETNTEPLISSFLWRCPFYIYDRPLRSFIMLCSFRREPIGKCSYNTNLVVMQLHCGFLPERTGIVRVWKIRKNQRFTIWLALYSVRKTVALQLDSYHRGCAPVHIWGACNMSEGCIGYVCHTVTFVHSSTICKFAVRNVWRTKCSQSRIARIKLAVHKIDICTCFNLYRSVKGLAVDCFFSAIDSFSQFGII